MRSNGKIYFLFTVLFLVNLNLLSCSKAVFQTKTWQYSQNEFKFVTLALFDRIFPAYEKNENSPNILEDEWKYSVEHKDDVISWFRNFEAYGHLATKLKIEQDQYYSSYVASNTNKLYDLWSRVYRTSKKNTNFSVNGVLQFHKVQLKQALAIDIIKNSIDSKTSLNKVIATYDIGSVTLYNLKSILPYSDWKSLILSVGDGGNFEKLFTEFVVLYINHTTTEQFFKENKMRLSLLQHLAHNFVADSYIQAKYHPITKGIYPTDPIDFLLQPTELFDYFNKYKITLRFIKEVVCSYAIFEDEVASVRFFRKLQDAPKEESFDATLKIFEEDVVEKRIDFKFTGAYQKSNKQLDIDMSEEDTMKSAIMNQIYADDSKITTTETLNGYMVLQVHKISYDKKKQDPSFSEYKWYLSNSLRTRLLQKQLTIDLKDSIDSLNIKLLPGAF